jgi:hypothetical protein
MNMLYSKYSGCKNPTVKVRKWLCKFAQQVPTTGRPTINVA